ncbi:MAG: glycosyltransferase family 39 protein [Nitrosopumilus sp.]|nr:glycosyltransferase family 39 protein [Nitrosopumilus sp.]
MTNQLDIKKKSIIQNPIILLIIIGIVSLGIRLYYFTPEIPVTLDAFGYFFYAFDSKIIGHLPENYSNANNGWPSFLWLIFSGFEFDNLLSYMQIQRISSILFSILTIIPIYFICRKYFNSSYSVIGSAIFAFEPRIIANSLFGLSEPMYIFLGALSICLILSERKKLIFVSFFVAGLATIVRGEGMSILFAISIVFFILYRKETFIILKYILGLMIFSLTILPMAIYRIETIGNDTMVGRVTGGIQRGYQEGTPFFVTGIENFIKFFGWDMIPIFIFFVPIGFILILKKFNQQSKIIFSLIIPLALPAFYAYSVPASDTRYLFILYPIFCLISIIVVKKFVGKFSNQNLIKILLVSCILVTSIVFLEYKELDMEHEKESYLIAEYLIQEPKTVNNFYPESRYAYPSEIMKSWPKSNDVFFMPREKGTDTQSLITLETSLITLNHGSNIEEVIENNRKLGITHLVVDDQDDRPSFFIELLENEKEYPYLIKEFDSTELMFEYKVKVFRINYDEFDRYKNGN